MAIKLTPKECNQIVEIFIRLYKERGRPERGELEQLWHEVISLFYTYQGYQIIPGPLRDAELSIVERGLGPEYFAALIQVVKPDPTLGEADQAILLITATPEEREKAIRKVLVPKF